MSNLYQQVSDTIRMTIYNPNTYTSFNKEDISPDIVDYITKYASSVSWDYLKITEPYSSILKSDYFKYASSSLDYLGTLFPDKVDALAGVALTDYVNLKYDPRVYTFRINPTTLAKSFAKDLITIKTAAGWTIVHWGESLRNFTFSGTSGYFKIPAFLLKLGINDVRLSPAYLRFMMFEKFYTDPQNDTNLTIVFENVSMQGAIRSFSYTVDANDPFQIKYTMNCLLDPSTQFNAYTGDVLDTFDSFSNLPIKEIKSIGSKAYSSVSQAYKSSADGLSRMFRYAMDSEALEDVLPAKFDTMSGQCRESLLAQGVTSDGYIIPDVNDTWRLGVGGGIIYG